MSQVRPFASHQAPGFASGLEAFGERVAIVTPSGERLTYVELAARADAFAQTLGPTRRLLMIEAANEIEPLVAYLGALRHGHPVLLTAGGGDHGRIAATYRPDAVSRKTAEGWTTQFSAPRASEMHPDLAVLLSTSGTTGAVKLVRLSRDAVEANARSIAQYLEIGPDDRPITTLPIHYSYGLSVVNSHLACGATILLTDLSVIDEGFWSFFEAEGATSLAGVPYTYELFERIGLRERATPSLKTMTQAGGRLPPETALTYARWARDRGVAFFVMYGQTEATARMAYVPPQLLIDNPGCVGAPIPGGAFRLIDEAGGPVEATETTGELVYAGANVMMGYALNEADLAKGAELDELHTGDLAQRTGQGLYKIVGRKSRFSKLFGLRIGLDEVEAALQRRGLKAAVAGDDGLVAIAVLAPADPAAIADDLAEDFSLPIAAFEVSAVADLPTLASGKVDYQAILRDAKARRAAPGGEPPSEAGAEVLDLFRRAFPRAALTPEASFVTLGGDSLGYVALSLDLEQQLGFLPLNWEAMPIAELQRLAVEAPPPRTGFWRPRALETEVLIRALAILAVVVSHASSLVIGGGAAVLLMLAGYNMSRYQLTRLTEGEGLAVLKSFVARIILPYYGVLLLYMAVKREIDIPSLTLTSNFHGRFGSLLEPYWFLEALLQCMVLVVVLFWLKPVRRAAARDPWAFGLGLLAIALVMRVAGLRFLDEGGLLQRTPDALFYLLAFGWCLQQATTTPRRVAMSLIVLAAAALDAIGPPGLWPRFDYPSNISHAAWLSVAGLAILWLPRLTLPNPLQTGLGVVAAASFYIYLTHVVPVHLLVFMFGIDNLALVVPASVALGLAAYWGMQRVTSGRPLKSFH
ncbi:AMP-binding protein [Phenylobacterium sp.]|uniref:AMP-binding protein n=1 Tax=Phenylobacterium sp. TaxID=1871053 RepID=UPI002734C70A|nr:AMP-binding protein [Phenylobacterium sp.]MDP3853500.1 AMP-binding protein [Phenylobacterium sp.]